MRRYAGDAAQHVVVIGGLTAPRRRRFGGRRSRVAEPGAAPVEVTRATVIASETLEREAAAAWLARDAAGAVDDALDVLNRALHARRIAAADPYRGRDRAPPCAGHAGRLRDR